MESGTAVRLVNNPGRIGVLSGRTRSRGGRTRVEVVFPGNEKLFVLENQIQVIGGDEEPLDLLQKGKLGRASDLRRNLTYIRLSGRLANLIYSMQTTHTDFYAYQFKPVLKLLDSPTNGLLIADEVGLGKTIEAGLIWTELRTRIDARRLLVLCPAMLREKWREELRQRFGVEAKIVNAKELLDELNNVKRLGDLGSFALIGSMQGLRPRRGWEDLPEEERRGSTTQLATFLDEHAYEEPLVDLLVIDEAHYLRNRDTSTSKLGHLLRKVSEYAVLLSATPIHLKSQDLYELLHLVDEDTFENPYFFEFLLDANIPLVEAREAILYHPSLTAEEFKEHLEEAHAHPLLRTNRQIKSLLDNCPTTDQLRDRPTRSRLAYQLDNLNIWSRVFTRTRKREVEEWRVIRNPVSRQVTLSPAERGFYDAVTEIVREYSDRAEIHAGFLYVTPQRQMASSMPAALRGWQNRYSVEEIELFEDVGEPTEGEESSPNDQTIRSTSTQDEAPLIEEIVRRVSSIADIDELWQNDSKYHLLSNALRTYFKEHPKEKVVLFAYFRPTLDYLFERLQLDGISSIVLKGGQREDKQETIARFRDPDGPRVLLSSEVGSEGIDLQFSRLLVNYDLPWNPMRVEQRIGRLDRLGQKSSQIIIWNLFAADTIEARIYDRLYLRIGIFQRALGGLESILGEEIRKLTLSLLRGHLTPEQEIDRIEQATQAMVNRHLQEERLEEQATNLIAYGDYILNQVKAAQELNRHITADDLEKYVLDFFTEQYPGCSFQKLEADKPLYDVDLSPNAKNDLNRYLASQRLFSQTHLDQLGSRKTRCHFENRVSMPQIQRDEVISQFHPLVRFVTQRTKEMDVSYHKVVSLRISQHSLPESEPGIYVFSVQRWTIEGLQKTELLYFAVMNLEGNHGLMDGELAEKLVTTVAQHGRDWLEAKNTVNLDRARKVVDECLTQSDNAFYAYVEQKKNENNDRADIQAETLERHYKSQRQKREVIKENHLREGRENLARAIQGQIDRLEQRIDRRRQEIDAGRNLIETSTDECIGLIEIEAS